MIYLARPRTRIEEVCPNKKCAYFQRKKGKDIVRRGFNKKGTQRFYCNQCLHYFVQTSGTPLYRKRLKPQKIEQLCRTLVEKNGIRSTARITKLNPITVMRWHDDLGEHAQQVSAYLTHDLGLSEYEVDEFWTTVKKNRNTTDPNGRLRPARAKHGATPASKDTRTFSRVSPSADGRKKPARAY